MDIFETLKIAFTALKSNKIRSFLTMLGIIIGVASVILLVAIGTGLRNYIVEQFESLGANTLIVMPGQIGMGSDSEGSIPGAGVGASKFTFDHLNEVKRKANNVKIVMAYNENNGTMRYKGNSHVTQVAGVGPEYPEIRDHKVVEGRFFSKSQYNGSKKVAVLGPSVVEELFKNANPLGKKMTISDQHYTVIGILEEKGSFAGVDIDDQVFIPATTSMDQFDLDYVQSFMVEAESSEVIPQAKDEIKKILLKYLDDDEFSVMDTKNVLQAISSVLNAITLALGGIAAISLLVGGIGIMNIMLVSVTERTKEVGLRKAVGATSQDILFQFLIEAIFLSLVGGMIGISVGVLGSMAISQFIKTSVSSWSVALSFGVSALVGIVFGVAPAAKAARLDPIEALRYE